MRRFYDVSYVNGRYIIQVIPDKYEVSGFYTDSKGRRRPITKSKRKSSKSRSRRFKIVSPEPVEESKPIIRQASYARNKSSKILRDWWIPEAKQLYDYLKRYDSRLTPIEIMALFREVKKRRPDWDYDQVYEYLDGKIDTSLTYGENKSIIANDLGRSEEEERRLYNREDYEDLDVEKLYQDYLNDIKDMDLPEAEYNQEYIDEPSTMMFSPEEVELYKDEVIGW